jgi:uncharacterized protein with PIN domain
LYFVLDGMLGKLARWLRMMGHDVKYANNMNDDELLAIAKTEKRVLLTRDLALYQQAISKGAKAYYMEGLTQPENLSELARRFSILLEIDLDQSRCPKCNTKIKSVPKEEIAGKVEKNTFIHYDSFWRCPNCDAVYWQGGHWTTICKTFEEAKEELRKES